MYKFRTNPKTLDKNVDAISTTVALKTECAWDGRSKAIARVHRDGGWRPGSFEGVPLTGFDSIGVLARHAVTNQERQHTPVMLAIP
jgi:hypothetical protein